MVERTRTPSFQRTDATGSFRRATRASKATLALPGTGAYTAKASLDRAGLSVLFSAGAAAAAALLRPECAARCSSARKDGSTLLLLCSSCGESGHLMRACSRRERVVVAGDSHSVVFRRVAAMLPLRLGWCKVRGASAAGLGNAQSTLGAAGAMVATLRSAFGRGRRSDGGAQRLVLIVGQVDLDFVVPYRALMLRRDSSADSSEEQDAERESAAGRSLYRTVFEAQLVRAIAGLAAFIARVVEARPRLLAPSSPETDAGGEEEARCDDDDVAARIVVHGVHPSPLHSSAMAAVVAKHIITPERPPRRSGDPRSTVRGSRIDVELATASAGAPRSEAAQERARAELTAALLELLPPWRERTALSLEWNVRVGAAVRALGCRFVDVNASGALLADDESGVVDAKWCKREWEGAACLTRGDGGDVHLNHDEVAALYVQEYSTLLGFESPDDAAGAATRGAAGAVDGGSAAEAALRTLLREDVAAMVTRVGKKQTLHRKKAKPTKKKRRRGASGNIIIR